LIRNIASSSFQREITALFDAGPLLRLASSVLPLLNQSHLYEASLKARRYSLSTLSTI
jgi:hypothetical protein